MTENKNYLQKYAMHFGTYMGIYWTLKFLLFPLGFTIPFLMFLFGGLTFAVPIIGYFYAKMYRDKICGGAISFAHACLFTLFMYMFASLLVAITHYIYFQFIDHGFVLEEYTKLFDQTFTPASGMENQKEFFMKLVDSLRALTPIDITMQYLSSDVFMGSLLSIPTALFVMKKNKNNTTGNNEVSLK